jgi:hypothetical protein
MTAIRRLIAHGTQIAVMLSCAVVSLAACSAPGAASGVPAIEFTPDERDKFTDLAGRVHVKALPKAWVGARPFWIDDRRVIFEVIELPNGWTRTNGELGKIILMDTTTGAIEETKYRGILSCYADHRIVVNQQALGHADYKSARFGDDLESTPDLNRHESLSGIDCRPVHRENGFDTVELEPGDGRIRVGTYDVSEGRSRIPIFFEDETGRVKKERFTPLDGRPAGVRFQFLPWSHEYFQQGAYGMGKPIAGSIAKADGDFRLLVPPTFLAQLASDNQGSGAPVASKPGMLWTFRTQAGFWPKQGLYFESPVGLVRVDDHAILTTPAVSPDGCKLLYGRTRGDVAIVRVDEIRPKYELALLNICNEVNQ